MVKQLIIISCCGLGGFAFGRWISPATNPRFAEQGTADPQVSTLATPLQLPPPERAGRVPFVDVYRSLRSSSKVERVTYLRSLQNLPDGPDRRAALTAFFQCMATINPQEAADLVRKASRDDIKRMVLAVIGATPAAQTPVLVKMLLDLPADTDPKWREQILDSQMFFWGALDPTAAAHFADQYQSTYPELVASRVIQCLTAADPAAGERWLNAHPDLWQQPEAVSNYIHGLYQNDPALARRYLVEHASDEAVQPNLKVAARLTFLSSADDALEFITRLPTKDARKAALAGILDTNTELLVNSQTSRTELSAGLAEWVTQFPPDDWPPLMSPFLNKWREHDPDGSLSWMANLPPPTRSAVARQLIRDLSGDPLKQVLASTAGDLHHDLVAAFASRLSQAPDDERKAVIEALELPPEDAAQLAAPR